MQKILVQLDTDQHVSPFDAIAAYDAGVDVILPYGGVTPDAVAALVQGAMFPRGPKGLVNTALWIGGSKVPAGEALLDAAAEVFFDPFRPSVMLDSDGCNTTAAAALARVRTAIALDGATTAVIGVGPVGLRCAQLLRREGAEVTTLTLPPDLFGDRPFRRASGVAVAEGLGLTVVEPGSSAELAEALRGVAVVIVAGPAGQPVLARAAWADNPDLRVVVDLSAAEPLGVEGVASTDDLVERDGKLLLGALAVGAPKMTLQRACVRELFTATGQVFDLDRIYDMAIAPA